MKLSNIKEGSFVRVICIKAENETERLNSFKITENSTLKVEKNQGGVIVSVNGRLIALSNKIADSIEVRYANSNNG